MTQRPTATYHVHCSTSSTRTTRCGTPASAKPIHCSPASSRNGSLGLHVGHRLEVDLLAARMDAGAQHAGVGLDREHSPVGMIPSSAASRTEQSVALPHRSAGEPSLFR